jgi:adenylate cyclase
MPDGLSTAGWNGEGNTSLASLAQAGRVDEARLALARMKETHPGLSIAWIEQNVPYTPDAMAKFLDGMRKAGLQ